MTPRRWLRIGVLLVLLLAMYRAVVPFGGDCGPAVYEAVRPRERASKLGPSWSRADGYRTRPCTSDGRRRLAITAVTAGVAGVGYVVLRRQLPDDGP